MSPVVNRCFEPEPKRQKLDPDIKKSSSSNCDHWFVRHGFCISCNSTVEKSQVLCLGYLHKEIQMSREALAFTKRVISKISWIEDKKLHLVLDLDHTLVHTVRVSHLFDSDKYLTEEVKSRQDLWRFNTVFPEILIKLRPFVHQFLKEACKMFSMYVYTKGGHEYAQLVLGLIDPNKIYFGDRVITRRGSPGLKTLDLVLADERGTVIVDDKRTVWPDHKRNLLQIDRYSYFRTKDDLETKLLFDLDGKKTDESEEKGPLANVLRFLKEIHKGFFNEKFEEELDSIDVRPLYKYTPYSRSKFKRQVAVRSKFKRQVAV